jgi:hypothetical protein
LCKNLDITIETKCDQYYEEIKAKYQTVQKTEDLNPGAR